MTATQVGPIRAALGLPGGLYAAYDLTATAVIATGPSILCTLTCQVAGSITVNDNDATGVSNTIANQIWSGSMTAGQAIALGWPCATGITASVVTTGTFSLTFS